jgi:hypothetical protein
MYLMALEFGCDGWVMDNFLFPARSTILIIPLW